MPDTSTADTGDTSTTSNESDKTQGDPADKPLGENGEKALRDERNARKAAEKAATDLQTRLDQLERANETALEKAQREATEAREAATRATVEALRFRIAAETGITEHIDLILTASDEETMRRQAELWASRTPASDTTTTAGPRPDLTQGGSGSLALNSDGLEDALKAKLGIA